MISLHNPKKEIEILVRAIIENKGKILVCQKIGRKYYFFPGGHIEFGESAESALMREIKEELGFNINECFFIGGSEHIFVEDGKKHQEINLAFEVSARRINTKSKENHLHFFFFDKKELVNKKILPKMLAKAILKWLKNKRPFWTNQIDKKY